MDIKGFDALTHKLKELEKAVNNLDGEIASLTFNPRDPQSIECAIQEFNSAIDKKIVGYAQNEVILSIANNLKEYGRSTILERATIVCVENKNEE